MIQTQKRHRNTHNHKHIVFCFTILVLLWVCIPNTFGSVQDEEATLIKTERRLPMLNGHRFVLSTQITDPFISSFVGTSTGFGAATDVNITIYDFEGEPYAAVQGNLAYMLLSMEYRQALNNWLSVWTQVEGLARMGINAESLLSQGITGVFGFELGGLARIWQNDRFQLSGSIAYRRSKFIGVDILGFVQRVIREGGIAPDNTLTKRIPTNRYDAGLHFTYAPADWVGFLASAELGFTDSIFDRGKNEAMLVLAGLASFDLNPRTGIPLGFHLGFNYTSYPENADDLIEDVRRILFKVAYTGRREFSIALEVNYLRAPLRFTDDLLSSFAGGITLRYYF
jgi:hypothetical protein